MLSVKQGGIKFHFFKVFGMTRPGIEPRSPGPLANPIPGWHKAIHTFLKVYIYFAYDDVEVKYVSHYTIGTLHVGIRLYVG